MLRTAINEIWRHATVHSDIEVERRCRRTAGNALKVSTECYTLLAAVPHVQHLYTLLEPSTDY